MSESTNPPHRSRMADQPAPRPVGSAVPDTQRPTYEELQAQAAGVDYSPLAEYLDDEARTALGLPTKPTTAVVDKATADRARQYFLDRPARIAALPDEVRTLLAL